MSLEAHGGNTGRCSQMGKRKKVYIRFIKTILKALKMAHVRRYPHKHDPKIYGVWVNVAILALRQLEDKSYRFVVELAAEMPNVLVLLEIADAPHWTTLHKAVPPFGDVFKKSSSVIWHDGA